MQWGLGISETTLKEALWNLVDGTLPQGWVDETFLNADTNIGPCVCEGVAQISSHYSRVDHARENSAVPGANCIWRPSNHQIRPATN